MRIKMVMWLSRLVAAALLTATTCFPAMAAIEYVDDIGTGTTNSTFAGSNNVSITVASPGVAQGDLIVLKVVLSGLPSGGAGPFYAVTPSDSQNNVYIARGSSTTGFNSTLQTVDFVATATTALQAGDSITVDFDAAGFSPTVAMPSYTAFAAALEFSGVSTTLDGGIHGISRDDGSTTTFDTGNVVTNNANDLVVSFLAVQSTEVTSLTQTTTPAFANATPLLQIDGITLVPMYSIKSATGSYGLQGTFNGTTSPFPPFIANVYALQESTAPANANLTIQKNHVGDFSWGQNNALYTITVTNTGGVATTGTTTVTDTLPAGLSFVSASSLGWSYSELGQVVTITTTSPIAAGGHSVINLYVNVAPDAENPVTNIASVACNAPCTVGPPASDPTNLIAVAPPPPPPPATAASAPVLNSGNLAVLILLFGMVALFTLRKMAS